jgi:hypothetical protein
MPTGRASSVRKLTDSSGGTASATDTIVDVPATYTEATLAAQLATIVRKLNQVIDVLAHRPR